MSEVVAASASVCEGRDKEPVSKLDHYSIVNTYVYLAKDNKEKLWSNEPYHGHKLWLGDSGP